MNTKLIPPRYHTLLWVLYLFLSISLLTRLGLMIFEGDLSHFRPVPLLKILTVGLVHDLAAGVYVLVPFALLALLTGNGPRGRRLYALLATGGLGLAIFGFLFTALAEGTFWNEFSVRFNFIAVDYLVYTREVLGNIWQSYPVGWLLGALGLIALLVLWLLLKPFWHRAMGDGGSLPRRLALTLVLLALPLLSFRLVGDQVREVLETPAEQELAGNGYYEFMRAFRANNLDYFKFYKVLPDATVATRLQQEILLGQPDTRFVAGTMPATRQVVADRPPNRKHLVLVSIESLGTDYVGAFGGKPGLTPNLDRLAREGMTFSQLYATGLRTVRGLEALTLSIPPTPGHAVPVRKYNTGLQTLGGVLKANGYQPFYIYGGYSYFDNMENFFAGNGYTVVDRTQVPDSEIHHETIWGIADEDILRKAIQVIGTQAAKGERVFAHIMTTSNHRPYTYPESRIDIPSGSGRDGAVKYTDWAIGDFMQRASREPWFADTVFAFVADHTSHGRGRTDLPPENYHIPLIVYAPGFIAHRQIDKLASQIDVAPTLLGLLDISYESQFFGQDILASNDRHQRAFMANYLTVGYLENGKVVELGPRQSATIVDANTGAAQPLEGNQALVEDVVSYYQAASQELHRITVDRSAESGH
ncbi:MAG TPA: LTA synthase family protein [Thiolinea sp.]|nr:LTA synthase family protein [Thiolinea sp.]